MRKRRRTHDAHLVRAATPRLTPYIPHSPTPPQAAFLLLPSLEAFYGGAAGGGKSDALLMAALQYVNTPGYAALLVRQSYQMLNVDPQAHGRQPPEAMSLGPQGLLQPPHGCPILTAHTRVVEIRRSLVP